MTAIRHVLARALLVGGALAVVLWCWATLPSFWLVTGPSDVSERILADDRFQPGKLNEFLMRIKSRPQPVLFQSAFLRSEALIQLRVAEEAIVRASPAEADREAARAENNIKLALSLNPTDAFLWLMLYSEETTRSGLTSNNIAHLERSYQAGPNEGWIALRRNRVALGAFSILGAELQNAVVLEFAALVDSEFFQDAELSLISAGWASRDRLLAGLAQVDIRPRKGFAKLLSGHAVGVKVPGIMEDPRPW
ncbi:hypothetical protein [Bradyrhizobium sp. CCBAU 45384]|uniref:hypothetical protein n=1 Tax=Bradyrhizobium sp. CCBAU 45384 TaxID=858428 RepID=UPI0023069ED5|nr:hypothetical protein [Bradyrhizobium sp. CCBAU 45384]